LDLKTLADFVDGQFAVSQGVKDRYSQGVSQSFEKVCLEFTKLLSHSSPCSSQSYDSINGSDMHICTFLHILMFYCRDVNKCLTVQSHRGRASKTTGCSGFNWLCEVDCWRLNVTLRYYDHEFMEVSGL